MNLSTTILGSTAVKQLQATTSAFVLEVGSDRFTRAQLAGVSCFNFNAAKNLTNQLRELEIKNLADLYERVPPGALALPHLGVISFAVLGAAFEAKRIGGDAPLESWARLHSTHNGNSHGTGGRDAPLVSFHTLKQREQAIERARSSKPRRRRRR